MNERIKELAKQNDVNITIDGMGYGEGDIERLVDLVVNECMEQVWYTREEMIDETISKNIRARIAKHFGVEE